MYLKLRSRKVLLIEEVHDWMETSSNDIMMIEEVSKFNTHFLTDFTWHDWIVDKYGDTFTQGKAFNKTKLILCFQVLIIAVIGMDG